MLNIYYKDNPNDIPKFINDIEILYGNTPFLDNEYTRTVLREIEKGEYYSDRLYKDRFGGLLYPSSLSTGSKILLALNYYKDYVINGVGLGANCYNVLTKCPNGNLYINFLLTEFENEFEYGCCVNDVNCKDFREVNYLLS